MLLGVVCKATLQVDLGGVLECVKFHPRVFIMLCFARQCIGVGDGDDNSARCFTAGQGVRAWSHWKGVSLLFLHRYGCCETC